MDDAFGRMVLDYWRDEYDGSGRYRSHTGAIRDGHPEWYFGRTFDEETETAIEHVHAVGGTVHDAGCGAGNHALELQDRGLDVVGTDVSRLALQVARERGVDDVALADLRSPPAVANCVFLSGTQFGVGGTVESFRSTLRSLVDATGAGGRVAGDLKDPFAVAESRLAGREELETFDRDAGIAHRRLRTEYRDLVGPWRSLLCLTPDAARAAVSPTPWTVSELVHGDGPRYYLVLDR